MACLTAQAGLSGICSSPGTPGNSIPGICTRQAEVPLIARMYFLGWRAARLDGPREAPGKAGAP